MAWSVKASTFTFSRSLYFAGGGLNPALGMLYRLSSNGKVMLQIPNCKAPGRKVYDIGPRVLAVKNSEIVKAVPLQINSSGLKPLSLIQEKHHPHYLTCDL